MCLRFCQRAFCAHLCADFLVFGLACRMLHKKLSRLTPPQPTLSATHFSHAPAVLPKERTTIPRTGTITSVNAPKVFQYTLRGRKCHSLPSLRDVPLFHGASRTLNFPKPSTTPTNFSKDCLIISKRISKDSSRLALGEEFLAKRFSTMLCLFPTSCHEVFRPSR